MMVVLKRNTFVRKVPSHSFCRDEELSPTFSRETEAVREFLLITHEKTPTQITHAHPNFSAEKIGGLSMGTQQNSNPNTAVKGTPNF